MILIFGQTDLGKQCVDPDQTDPIGAVDQTDPIGAV